jgi:hypothetical protein
MSKKGKLIQKYNPLMLCYEYYFKGDSVGRVGFGDSHAEAKANYLEKEQNITQGNTYEQLPRRSKF